MKKHRNILIISMCFLIVVGFVAWGTFGHNIFKNAFLEKKIERDLMDVYPGSKISKVTVLENSINQTDFYEKYNYYWYEDISWNYDKLCVFEIDDRENSSFSPILGLANKEGKVIYDEYAFIYYREEMQAYVMNIIDAENNFPGITFEYFDNVKENSERLVCTEKCGSFEGFLEDEYVGVFLGQNIRTGFAGCLLTTNVDTSNDEAELVFCTKLKEVLIEANCRVNIEFIGYPEKIANYYPEEIRTVDEKGYEYATERFCPKDDIIKRDMKPQ